MTEVLDYLDDILAAAEKIERFTGNMSYEEFLEDEKTVDAVLRNFEVIGEAAKNVPDDVRREYSDVPWSEMAGMRDKLIHGYATVELRIVWQTVQDEIPTLTAQIGQIRAELDSE
ncbi:DUF86 domain-containing protein [Halalkaliarchaeum sp. AArc-GB]|uniref:HepT-like ribonuclease domain-containing protein n=1 Tax=Halalkaliarchaeum sp. AArc-GB TaxID=3074078 RepID=UPI002854E694|nr:DUF86 domain-containing protein [Halalkaliarchaeum sp. AArc-GB]MDR5674246.1 DUF86 domain-containing protein [Halalkaliarchaeum sp. AArc-GB]